MRDVNFGMQVSLGLVGRVISLVISFLGSIFLARIVGPDVFGQYFLVLAAASLLDNPITGWAQGGRKRLTEQDFPRTETAGAVYLSLLAIPPVAVVSAVVLPHVRPGFPLSHLMLALLAYLAMASYTAMTEVLNGTVNFGGANWIGALRDVLRVIIQVGLVLVGYSFVGLVGGFVAATLLVLPVLYRLTGITPSVPSKETLRSVWIYARHSIPRRFLGTALTRMDILLLGALVTASSSGWYQAALNLTIPATLLSVVASPGIMSRISALESADETDEIATHAQRAINFSSIIAVPIVAGAAVFGTQTVVLVYSSQYAEAGAFVIGIAVFQLLKSQTSIYTSIIEGIDRPDITLRYTLVQFVVNLFLGIALLYSIGGIGVVVATVIAKALHYVLTLRAVKSRIPINPIGKPIRHQLYVATLMALVIGYLERTAAPGETTQAVGILALGAAIYGTGLLASSQHRDVMFGLLTHIRESMG